MSIVNNLLIVDDEKNIRFTLKKTLESLDLKIDDAVNGEEALKKISKNEYNLLLLDLKMPGIDGIEVLRIATKKWPDMKVIVITAHGTIDLAVEAMKLGAVDFLQKPFSPTEIRDLVSRVLNRDVIRSNAEDYNSSIELAKKNINQRRFDTAITHVKKAIGYDSSRPDAYNILGVLMEIKHDILEAQKQYRIALSIDPGYKPALTNLHRVTDVLPDGEIDLGETQPQEKGKK